MNDVPALVLPPLSILSAGRLAPPATSAMGALIRHITCGADAKEARGGRKGRRDRYRAYIDRAKASWLGWLDARGESPTSGLRSG